MTISELLKNEDVRQSEFPVTRHKVFLAHAGVCPLPRRVTEAMAEYLRLAEIDDQEAAFAVSGFSEARQRAARLISCRPEEVAFVGPTSLGLSYVASGVPWRKGDNVLCYFDDYPSNVYPWMALADRGVEVRFLKTADLGLINPAEVEKQVDDRTRLVALASCHFISGYRIDVEAIGAFLRSREILFCLDGIQTVGAFPTPVSCVDFLAADGHKWLLGPTSAGILYVRGDHWETLRPPIYGWHNVRSPNFVAQEQMVMRADSRRYEAGSANLVGLAGLNAAFELLLELGIDRIANELLRKRSWLLPAIQEKGYSILQAEAAKTNGSAILSFFRDGADLPALQQKLADAGILTSLRADRSGRHYLRISPHFYNTDAELQRFLEYL